MNTPYFLIHENILKENIDSFADGLEKEWKNSQLCYSVKTNSLPWLLSYINKHGILAEVVSDEEYALALAMGIPDRHIVFNGPIKGEHYFARALEQGAVINLDSKSDIQYLEKYSQIAAAPDRIGIRINVPCSIFDEVDIAFEEDGFRFGFSAETGEFQDVVSRLQKLFPSSGFGLHLHVNSVTRSRNVYQATARYAAHLIKSCHLKISFIDMGGGFFGGVEGKPTPAQYIQTIRSELENIIDCEKVKLYVEPGSAIIGSTTDLVTSVLDRKETGSAVIVTTDGSRIHIDPLWKKKNYRYEIVAKETQAPVSHKKQIICGYTCMDYDRIMTLENVRTLQPEDQIVYQRVGAYSMTFGGAFIRYLPEVYVVSDGKLVCVRSGMSTDDYIALHSKKCENNKGTVKTKEDQRAEV